MPIYEYSCQKCGDVLEVTQKITDPPLKRHNGASKCGGKLTRLISMNSFHLKGTGWYKTDYANPKPKPKKEKKEKKAAPSPDKD
ncbi:MAG: FmdB family zinc ribbon protein [Candidatus Nitrospinota bacterium M3_3B_026]